MPRAAPLLGVRPSMLPCSSTLETLEQISTLAAAVWQRDDVFGAVLAHVAEGLGWERVCLYRLREGAAPLRADACVGEPLPKASPAASLEASPEVRVARSGEALIRLGTRWLSGPSLRQRPPGGRPVSVHAALPVRCGGRCVGVLSAARRRLARSELPDAVRALEVVANQLGMIYHGRDLIAGNEAKVRQLLAVQRISRQMTSAGETSALLQLMVDEALALTGADGGALYLAAKFPADKLHLAAWGGEDPAPGREEVPLGYGIVGWVARSGIALRAADRGGGLAPAEYTTRRNQLAVPLVSEGRILGVLAVTGRSEEAFSATHEELLSIFAAQAAKAIEAGRLLQQVREERDLRDRILSGTPNGVIALDGERRVLLMNQAARRCFGVREDPEGNPVERFLAASPFLEKVRDVLDTGSRMENEEFTVNLKRGPRQFLASAFPLETQRGATLILQDLTERRRFDERVQRMSRLVSIGQLAAGVAHEIRNPLTGVAISLDILREEQGLSDEGRSLLDDINREIDRLEALIRGMLDFARPQPAEFRPIRLAKALEWQRTFREQCRKKGVRLHVDLRHNPKILGDPERLKQLFLNLAINALDAAPPGGEIRMWSERLAASPQPGVRVWVEDDGPGMDEATLAQIFNPFFTTKNEGTGLGLSIVHSIVEQHGGKIDVQSRPGEGTRFAVDLSVTEEE